MLRFDEKLLSRSKASLCEETNKLNPDTQLFDYENEDGMHNLILVEEGETEEEDIVAKDSTLEDAVEEVSSEDKRKDWRRIRKYYERSKQYIFVAATLPVNGKKTAGGVLKKMFPGATLVSGDYLHCHNPR